jgi:hypothetical protein
MTNQRFHIPLAALFCCLTALLVFQMRGFDAFAESGFVENITVFFYGVAIAALFLFRIAPMRVRLATAIVLAALAARELDLHKAFTADSLLKSNYYLKSGASLMEKSLSILFLLCLAGIVVWLVRATYKNLIADLMDRKAYAWSILASIALVGISKSIDGIGRKLKGWFGIQIDTEARNYFRVIEETAEMMIPLAIIIACLQVWQMSRGAPHHVIDPEQSDLNRI